MDKINFLPVMNLDRDDIESIGFDASTVDDTKLTLIADKLHEYYIDTFYSALYDICKLLKIKERNAQHTIVATDFGEVLVNEKGECYIGDNFDNYIGIVDANSSTLEDDVNKMIENTNN